MGTPSSSSPAAYSRLPRTGRVDPRSEGEPMSEVTVVGLGAMGAAIAGALLDAGRTVTVWNRTAAKADPLVARGAIRAETAADAASASVTVVVCLDNHDVSMSVLRPIQSVMMGKTLIQLTSDTGTAADELASWAASAGANYLDGVILAYPSDIGSTEASVLLAGDRASWADSEPLMRDIAGRSTYVGDNVRVPSMLSAAAIAPLLGIVIGAVQGAVLCESEGFPVGDYAGMMTELASLFIDQMQRTLSTIAEGRFDQAEAALKTYASSIKDRTDEGHARAVNVEFYAFVNDILSRAIAEGLGDEEMSAIIKLWR